MMLKQIGTQLGRHAPFTVFGAATGLFLMAIMMLSDAPGPLSHGLFWTLHPLHVVLSALTTTAMYKLGSFKPPLMKALVIGYVGSIGIATLSDSLIPYLGEWLLDLPNRGIHIGFIEKWWLVNQLAALGIYLGWRWPMTKAPHTGHVLLSTWASLFHMSMALSGRIKPGVALMIGGFLLLAVWIPCCASDIVFPLLFTSPTDASPAAEPTAQRPHNQPRVSQPTHDAAAHRDP